MPRNNTCVLDGYTNQLFCGCNADLCNFNNTGDKTIYGELKSKPSRASPGA